MRIIYPYNEILPKRKAHDVFVFHECASLATHGNCDITLLVGKGSNQDLFSHYHVARCPKFHLHPIFIIRKNNPLGLSWNFPFFFLCQRYIERERPDAVICSVRGQATYHLKRKIPGVQYVYEVHELAYYPNEAPSHHLQSEREMLAAADLITVTTEALQHILKSPPYSLENRIEVVPLAVQAHSLPPPPSGDTLQLGYVGQLYAGQGLPTLLTALSKTKKVHLNVLGGKPHEILDLKKLARELGVEGSITFLGFIPPSEIPSKLKNIHAFVAPFENTGRMPYVAHTKLFEYAHWGRPIIAPNLPVVREHFASGVLLYEPANPSSLAACIHNLQQESIRAQLQEEITLYAGYFSWSARAQAYTRLLGAKKNNKK